MPPIEIVQVLIHVGLLLLLPPLLLSIINQTKAAFAGRVGPPLLQTYRDLWKLLRKGMVLSRSTTWVFLAGPVVGLVTALLAGLLVPLGGHAAPLSFTGDAILFAYLLGLGRFFITLAALDTGSAFEGMGAAREVTFACLTEPAFFFGLLVMAKLSGSLSLTVLLHGPAAEAGLRLPGAAVVLVTASWFLVLLAENARIPFDDPNTHLELTMIHEVMVLDHSGPALALVEYGAAVKLFVMEAVLFRVVDPWDGANPWADWGIVVLGLGVLAVLVGVVESSMARLRLLNVPRLLITACVLSGFGVFLLVR